MKKNGYFYYNELKEIGVLYDKYSGKIFKIPMKVAKAGKLSELNIEDEKRLDALLVNKPICKDFTDSKELNHLRLMLTNKCNFACTYCYADEGSYGFNQDEVMSSELAVDIINWGYSRYEHIKQISFFGGEPLLNLDAIESVCSHTLKLYKENKIKKLPLFSVVTNGYLLQDSVVDLIRKYKIYPVISIDGPKSVHDKQRVLKNRNGTYDVVSSNLKKLRELMPFSLEATFTSNHDLENITTDDVRIYLEKEFNVSRILVNKTYAYKDGSFLI